MILPKTVAIVAGAWSLLCLSLYAQSVMPALHPEWMAGFWRILPPVPGDIVAAVARHGDSLFRTALLCLAAGALGAPVWRLAARASPLPSISLLVAIGLVFVLPFGALGLGLAGLLREPLVPVILSAVALAAVFLARRGTMPRLSGMIPAPGTLALGGILLLPSLLCALAPQTQYDALQYHFSLPRQFLDNGRIFLAANPWPYAGLPLGQDLLFACAMACGGDGVAQMVNWTLLPLALVLLARSARAAGMPGVLASLSWVLLASSPLISMIAGQAFTDAGPLLAVSAAVRIRFGAEGPSTAQGRGAAFMFGLCLGAAGAAKFSAGALALCILVPLSSGRTLLPALAGWLLPQVPWAARSWLFFGSPFGGAVLASVWPSFLQYEETLSLAAAAVWVGIAHPSLWLWFPLYALRDAVEAGHELSPFIVILLPGILLAFRGGRANRVHGPLALAALLSFALWALAGGGQVRYLVPALPVMILAALAPISGSVRRGAHSLAFTAFVRVALAAAAVTGLARSSATLYPLANPLNVSLGLEPVRPYLARLIRPSPFYMAAGSYFAERPSLGRPYLAGDLKSYYWPRDPVFDSQYMTPYLVRCARDAESESDILARLRQKKIGSVAHWREGSIRFQHIVGGYRWTDRSLALLQGFMVRHLKPLKGPGGDGPSGAYFFYSVEDDPQTPPGTSDLAWWSMPYTERLHVDADLALLRGDLAAARERYRALARKFPSLAIPHLRLMEIARLEGDARNRVLHERTATRLLSGRS